MRKYKLSELKNLVKLGMAKDLTNATAAEVMEQWKRAEKVGYSSGVYGINGGLIQNIETGEYYAITARNSNLFRIF
jgi:carbonic anhydrase